MIEVLRLAMEELVDEGLVRSLGVANFSLAQLEALLATARIRPVVLQVELHPLLAQRKLVGVCMRKVAHAHTSYNDLIPEPRIDTSSANLRVCAA